MEKGTRRSELAKWVRLYTKDLLLWAINKTADRHLAEDLVQETFLAAAENMEAFKGDSQVRTWLLGILKNKIAEYYTRTLRKYVGRPLPMEDLSTYFVAGGHWTKEAQPNAWGASAENLTDIPAFNRILDNCIEHLPEIMNACIRLKFLDEKKGAQICQELGITATNYWQLIRRAKLQLRDCLENNWFKAK
ncbi:sigma-70 family RNA polymerase sigma factor [Flavilitoribacter nigricans]|uniref:RNA polymerase subunit sigma n=1 Tax=Flavilitoribacter nigricans (strain ATCC 23147 / DSM 23189 / NBRC 102662 / NCIMB 1420 / SS-2) TaxID=1122177 RepID=A0A2D0N564_FLAN2|nr:sigma-70 family RNA polymerase sigma factor [Flavilitoribacter nigricans]PHN03644.1 RNA polymerase subunit sigma [Flavilitoribacter nigricans DSM 23189 = NBRC 102662]